ncbi:MAG: radical SAM protein [Methanopyri archaeon]|nr:radical SAM protein [Methanopyri archaeon]
MRLRNKVRAGWAIFKSHIFDTKTPVSVVLMSNDSCNLKCKYCAIWKTKRRQMTTKELLDLVDELADMGCVRISIFGGEPLVRDDIGQIVDHIHKRGINVGLGSNGILVPKKIDQLKDLDHLHISLDGPEEYHDIQRGKGSHAAAIRAIKAGKEAGLTVWTMTVLTRHNLHVVDYMLDLADEHDMIAYFHPVSPRADSGPYVRDLVPPLDAYRGTIDLILKRKAEGRRVGNSTTALNYFLHFPQQTIDFRCWAGKLFCHIDANGDVFGCLENKDKSPPNNLLDKGFRKAWDEITMGPCPGCWSYSTSDFNFLFSLEPHVIWNTLKLTR